MPNFLVVYVSTEFDTEQKMFESVYQFLNNIVDQGVFSRSSDRFVVYLEDLYKTPTQRVSDTAKDYLSLVLDSMGVMHYEIYANNLRDVIIRHCKPTYPLIENHFDFVLNFLRAIISPISLKELFQLFGLHYETVTTSKTTVYHDLDMRYSIKLEDRDEFPSQYRDAQHHSLARLPRSGQSFDIFWSLNTVREKTSNLFLNAFYSTILSIINHSGVTPSQTGWVEFKRPTASRDLYRDTILKPVNFDENLKSSEMTKKILFFHLGYSRVQNNIFSRHTIDSICRNKFCAPRAFNVPPYNIAPLHFQRVFTPREGLCGYFSMPNFAALNNVYTNDCMPTFSRIDDAQYSDGWPGGVYTAVCTEVDHWSMWGRAAEESTLTKTIYGKWQQIPVLKETDISEIVGYYPFMAYVLVLTKGLRTFAYFDSNMRQQKRIEKNTLDDDSWVWFLECQSCRKNFLPKMDKNVSGFVFCKQSLAVFCESCHEPFVP